MIPVTKTFLPPVEDYNNWVKKAFDNQWLTNRGELIRLLEDRLKEHLKVEWLTVTNNGTIPLQIALKLLAKQGEVITTPFSYVATTSAIIWENCTPVFVDIHPEYLTIDETKLEAAITDKTTAILATHVFGNPCHIEEIERIAQKYNLAATYDAAHCFGAEYNGKRIFERGDGCTCGCHATTPLHTAERGPMCTPHEALRHQLFYSHNCGHKHQLEFHRLGLNAKRSESQAAMGLSVLPHMKEI